MIRARETRCAVAITGGEPGATMTAYVGERAQRAVGAPHDEDRNGREILSYEIAGMGEVGTKSHNDRIAPEQNLALTRCALRLNVRAWIVRA